MLYMKVGLLIHLTVDLILYCCMLYSLENNCLRDFAVYCLFFVFAVALQTWHLTRNRKNELAF